MVLLGKGKSPDFVITLISDIARVSDDDLTGARASKRSNCLVSWARNLAPIER